MAEKPFALPNKEMGYLWDRGNAQPLSYFSIMATTLGNSNNASGSGLNANAMNSKLKSWDERVDEFSLNLEANNAFCDDDGTRFFVIKKSEGDFSKTSPFLIEKAINSVVGTAKSIKKNFDQVSFFLKYKTTNKQQI